MEHACTKKLLEYVGIKAEKMNDDMDPLFAWTATNLPVGNDHCRIDCNRNFMLCLDNGVPNSCKSRQIACWTAFTHLNAADCPRAALRQR